MEQSEIDTHVEAAKSGDVIDAAQVDESRGRRRHQRPSPQQHGLWRWDLMIAAVVFVVQSLSPTPQTGDSRLSVVTAWQFLHHFNLHLERYPRVTELTNHYDMVKHAGHIVPFFPWPTMLFAIPADVLYSLTGHNPALLSISSPNRTWPLEVATASLLVAITAVMIRRIVSALDSPWSRPSVAVLAALVFAFCTSAWSVGSRALWQQTTSMLFLAAVLLAIQRIDKSRVWPFLLGVFLAMAFLTRPTNAIIVVLVLGWLVWRKLAALPFVLVGIALCAVPFVVVSLNQYGQALPPYYVPSRLEQLGPFTFWNSLFMNLISPSRGLLIYDPIVFLAGFGVAARTRARRLTDIDVLMCVAVVGHWLTISAYESTGGATYGPRLMIDTLPFLTVLSAPALSFLLKQSSAATRAVSGVSRVAVAAMMLVLLCWGGFVNATGGVLRGGFCWSANPVPVDSRPSRVWDWSDPQFLRPYRELLNGVPVRDVVAGSCATLEKLTK
ncbi:MAG: hypothetical protein WAV54_15215 [Acidimicrobiales bacterium]